MNNIDILEQKQKAVKKYKIIERIIAVICAGTLLKILTRRKR